MFWGETVTCNFSWNSSGTHTLTQNILLCLGKEVKRSLNKASQVFSLCVWARKSWRTKRTKTTTHPSSREQCYPTMKRQPWAAPKNYMIWSFELLLGNYVNPCMEESHFPQHNWPLAHSLYVLWNMVGMVKMWELRIGVKVMMNAFVYVCYLYKCQPVQIHLHILAQWMMG